MKANSFTVMLRAVAAVILVLSTTEAARHSRQTRPCSPGTSCVDIGSCPEIQRLLSVPNRQNIGRVRQAICEQRQRRIRVCCGTSSGVTTPPTDTTTQTTPGTPTGNPGGNGHLLPSNCGQVAAVNKIFGGTDAVPGEYPWIAALGYEQRPGSGVAPEWQCGGALINSRYVLTAAHCAHRDFLFSYTLTIIRLGEHDYSKDQDCSSSSKCLPPVQDFTAENIIIHPAFNSRAPVSDDIALIRLDRNAQLNSAVHPICLPSAGLDAGSFLGNVDAVVIGWGHTERGGSSQVLQKVRLPFVPLDECRRIHSRDQLVDEQICFGGRAGQDSCKGDSGGPLFKDTLPGTLLGIVSKGGACGSPGVPAIYTDVASYRNWVTQTIRP